MTTRGIGGLSGTPPKSIRQEEIVGDLTPPRVARSASGSRSPEVHHASGQMSPISSGPYANKTPEPPAHTQGDGSTNQDRNQPTKKTKRGHRRNYAIREQKNAMRGRLHTPVKSKPMSVLPTVWSAPAKAFQISGLETEDDAQREHNDGDISLFLFTERVAHSW